MSVPTTIALPKSGLLNLGLRIGEDIHYQLGPEELAAQAVARGEGVYSDTGALVIKTGEFTGRSPKDKFIVKDGNTADSVHWNEFNIAMEAQHFDQLYSKMMDYLEGKELWVRDCYACADPQYRLNIRVVNENPWSNLFAYNMFLRPKEEELEGFQPHWHIVQAPGFRANPDTDGTRQHNFAAVNFAKRTILIGGTGYTGEMKKGIFTILNYVLPHEKGACTARPTWAMKGIRLSFSD
jgi:phosphoenolpyruvate carboxykinase (ATP)